VLAPTYLQIQTGEESFFFGSILCYVAKVAMIPKNISPDLATS
jgi:hypothetical protein